MKKWITLAVISCSLLACQIPISQPANIQVVELSAQKIKPAPEIPVSQTPGAKIHLNFQYGSPEADFETKLSCTVASHLQSFRIYLIDGSTSFGSGIPLGLLPADLSTKALPNASTFYPVNKTITGTGQTQSVTLSNVNTGSYYLAVAAFDGPNGTGANITSLLSALFNLSLISGQKVIVSGGGGNASNPGRVEIGPAASGFPILNSSEPSLTVNLKLGLLCL